jgi:hypothetical protein
MKRYSGRQQAHQESEALITQPEAFKSSQQLRASVASHPRMPHPGTPHPGSGAGPCGEMPTSSILAPKEPTPQSEEPQ